MGVGVSGSKKRVYSHMKIVKFLGGFGNQLFQYAFYLALKQKFGKVKADLSDFENYTLHQGFELEKILGIRLPQATAFELKLYKSEKRTWLWRKLRRLYATKNAYIEENPLFGYDSYIFTEKRNRYYWGYWQHINYLLPVEEELRSALRFPEIEDNKNRDLARLLMNRNAVSVHVRRGDYLGNSMLGGICDMNYYEKSIAYIQQHVSNPLFVFFSNDAEWCSATFQLTDSLVVDWNQGENSFRDMQLMSHCKHHIIANSSFSWWGAWLNTSDDKIVVSPSKWVNDPHIDASGIILPDFVTL